jgi:hypothetical protein
MARITRLLACALATGGVFQHVVGRSVFHYTVTSNIGRFGASATTRPS